MVRHLLCVTWLFLGFWSTAFASSDDWWLTAGAPPEMVDSDKHLIGSIVCGADGFEVTKTGVHCSVCPEFTSNAGSDKGLEIGHIVRGRFTAAGTEGEWLLDTDGCEAHFENFGGAILLGFATTKPVLGMPAATQGSRLAAKPASVTPARIFYQPGFRLNDCLSFGSGNSRTLLVCNEADLAQGEVIGHISAMEVSRRGITRWRLLRWYDNTGTDSAEIVSVIPTGMRRLELDNGREELQIKLRIIESDRAAYEKGVKLSGKIINLEFQRKGQRFFANAKTQLHIKEINLLTRKVFE